ncbi:hypothetical protein [Desulfonatronum thioautotrophicum]|uniref:hypothetical protein n=1 Tax=Desulfonatronum thioautotrophicum TaxID=617001 RepID=UPI0005EAFE54|nr:hypothetical protein [Desulfonatronum thioautotrophicum]
MSENREAYVKKLKAKIDEWNADIDKLSAKAKQVKAGKEVEYREQIETLRAKRADLEKKMAELQEASESTWENLKSGVETSWEALKEGYSAAKARYERDAEK